MKNVLYLIFSLFCVLFYSCDKDPLDTGKLLLGEWEFKKAQGGFTGHDVVLPPPNTKSVISFTGRSYKLKVNGLVTKEGAYSITKVKSIFSLKDEDAIILDDTNSAGLAKIISIKCDSLLLTDNHVEPYGALYVRIK